MIRIERTEQAPRSLREKGPGATHALWASYSADPAGVAAGSTKLKIDSAIYGAADVKAALIAMQHDKCAFCESKVSHVSFGDVEHFRPKRGWKQGVGGALQRPGYFWLAYTWENLLFACEVCNRRHKGNLFPLLDAGARATPASPSVEGEKPLFIDPSADPYPEKRITFHGPDPMPVGGDAGARMTIQVLALGGLEVGPAAERRPSLRERRLGILNQLRHHVEVVAAAATTRRIPEAFKPVVKSSVHEVLQAIQPAAEFAGMSRAFVHSSGLSEVNLLAVAAKL